jgi:hypothetical protein
MKKKTEQEIVENMGKEVKRIETNNLPKLLSHTPKLLSHNLSYCHIPLSYCHIPHKCAGNGSKCMSMKYVGLDGRIILK